MRDQDKKKQFKNRASIVASCMPKSRLYYMIGKWHSNNGYKMAAASPNLNAVGYSTAFFKFQFY